MKKNPKEVLRLMLRSARMCAYYVGLYEVLSDVTQKTLYHSGKNKQSAGEIKVHIITIFVS